MTKSLDVENSKKQFIIFSHLNFLSHVTMSADFFCNRVHTQHWKWFSMTFQDHLWGFPGFPRVV